MARFRKRSRLAQEIPTGPMPDISFLLVVFFMVTTVFVVYRGFPVNLPRAETVEALKQRRNIASVWIALNGRIMVDEFDFALNDVGNVVAQKLRENPRIVIQIKSDEGTPYRLVSGVIEELRRVNAVRVSFIAKKE
jgi:biopolymer transport protein ExbD